MLASMFIPTCRELVGINENYMLKKKSIWIILGNFCWNKNQRRFEVYVSYAEFALKYNNLFPRIHTQNHKKQILFA